MRLGESVERKPRSQDRADASALPEREDFLGSATQLALSVRKQREVEADERSAGLDDFVRRVETHPHQLAGGRPLRHAARAGGRGETVEDITAAELETTPELRKQPSSDSVAHDVRAAAEDPGDELLRRVVLARRRRSE